MFYVPQMMKYYNKILTIKYVYYSPSSHKNIYEIWDNPFHWVEDWLEPVNEIKLSDDLFRME